MTQDELNRAQAGFRIQHDIYACRNNISGLKEDLKLIENQSHNDNVCVLHSYIDIDLVVVAFTEQIKRYERRIAELEREFDEL